MCYSSATILIVALVTARGLSMAAMFLGLAILTTMSLGMQYHSVIWGIGLFFVALFDCQYDHNQCVQRVDHLLVIHLSALRIDHTRDFYPSGAPTYFVRKQTNTLRYA
jgi:hypothetical protein